MCLSCVWQPRHIPFIMTCRSHLDGAVLMLETCLQLFVADLMVALEQHPPPQPSQPAVDLLVSVGQQQKYLDANGLLPPAGHPGAMDALQVGNVALAKHQFTQTQNEVSVHEFKAISGI